MSRSNDPLNHSDDIQQCVLVRTHDWCWVSHDHSFPSIAIGAAYGTSKAGIGIAGLGQFKPELIMKVCMADRMNHCQLSCSWNTSPLFPSSCRVLLPSMDSLSLCLLRVAVSLASPLPQPLWTLTCNSHLESCSGSNKGLFSVCRLHSSRCRSRVWIHWTGRGLCDWHRGRRSTSSFPITYPSIHLTGYAVRTRIHLRVARLRIDGPHPHLC